MYLPYASKHLLSRYSKNPPLLTPQSHCVKRYSWMHRAKTINPQIQLITMFVQDGAPKIAKLPYKWLRMVDITN